MQCNFVYMNKRYIAMNVKLKLYTYKIKINTINNKTKVSDYNFNYLRTKLENNYGYRDSVNNLHENAIIYNKTGLLFGVGYYLAVQLTLLFNYNELKLSAMHLSLFIDLVSVHDNHDFIHNTMNVEIYNRGKQLYSIHLRIKKKTVLN